MELVRGFSVAHRRKRRLAMRGGCIRRLRFSAVVSVFYSYIYDLKRQKRTEQYRVFPDLLYRQL